MWPSVRHISIYHILVTYLDSSAWVTPSITAFDLVVLKDWRDVSLFCKHSQRRLQEKDWDEAIWSATAALLLALLLLLLLLLPSWHALILILVSMSVTVDFTSLFSSFSIPPVAYYEILGNRKGTNTMEKLREGYELPSYGKDWNKTRWIRRGLANLQQMISAIYLFVKLYDLLIKD